MQRYISSFFHQNAKVCKWRFSSKIEILHIYPHKKCIRNIKRPKGKIHPRSSFETLKLLFTKGMILLYASEILMRPWRLVKKIRI